MPKKDEEPLEGKGTIAPPAVAQEPPDPPKTNESFRDGLYGNVGPMRISGDDDDDSSDEGQEA